MDLNHVELSAKYRAYTFNLKHEFSFLFISSHAYLLGPQYGPWSSLLKGGFLYNIDGVLGIKQKR